MKSRPIIPIILCGGSGTRLWPLSRDSFPKQYLNLSNNGEKSLLQETQERIKNLDNTISPIIICNEEHRFIVAEQLREINTKPLSILLEPIGRNTAPAIALAALKASEIKDDPIIIVLSSDHLIQNKKSFIEVLKKGITFAEKGKLVTFGIIPRSPETGYGYIKAEKTFSKEDSNGSKILEFTEKPDIETAKSFLKDKRYTWNSGMFMFTATSILNEIKRFSPEIYAQCFDSIEKSNKDLDFQRLNKDHFLKCPNLSIDCAVMEKTTKGVVLPMDVGWSDIGSWQSVWDSAEKDLNGNFSLGKTLIEKTKNCYIRSENRLVVALGLKDLVIVETNDAILISNKKDSQLVKDVVKKLKDKKIPEGLSHRKIYRPWGHYVSIVEDSRWQVKLIKVKPGEQLSLQMHHHRSEHWVVVNGTAQIELNSEKKVLTENQSVYIPLGSKHRLSNPGKIPLVLIEVQSGSYVGEDDIVRFEDRYGRQEK